MINSARFNRRQEGGNDSNQYQIQNFSLLQSHCIDIADPTSFSKKIIGLDLSKILTTKKCILISSKHLWPQKKSNYSSFQKVIPHR